MTNSVSAPKASSGTACPRCGHKVTTFSLRNEMTERTELRYSPHNNEGTGKLCFGSSALVR